MRLLSTCPKPRRGEGVGVDFLHPYGVVWQSHSHIAALALKCQAKCQSPLRGCMGGTLQCSHAWHFTLKEMFLAVTLVTLGIAGPIWQASPAAAPIPVRSLLVFLGSLMAIMAVVTGLFHRGLGKALASGPG